MTFSALTAHCAIINAAGIGPRCKPDRTLNEELVTVNEILMIRSSLRTAFNDIKVATPRKVRRWNGVLYVCKTSIEYFSHVSNSVDLVEVGIDFQNSWEMLWMNKRLPRTKGMDKLRPQYNYCDSRRHILIT